MSINSGESLTFASASIANIIAKNLDAEEIALLAAFLTTLGDNLALIAITRDKTT